MSDNLSLKDGFELLIDGKFDDRLRRLSSAKQRRARRIKRRLKRGRYSDEFYDELIPEMKRDTKCCELIPALASGTLDEETPLGWDSDQFFEFLDGLLERLPDIIDAILSIITLFAALLFAVALSASSATAEELPPSTPYCPDGQCPIVRTAAKTVAAPAKATSSLAAAIRRAKTPPSAIGVSPNTTAMLAMHLTTYAPDHRYTYTQADLAGLSHSDLWKLHALNHTSGAIPPSRTPVIRQQGPVIQLQTTGVTQASGDCPSGQCARPSATTQRRGFIGRLFGR